MSNMIKRDPFAMDTWFDDLMKGYWVRPMQWPKDLPDMQSIRMDMKESDSAYTIHAEMPGVRKEDIRVSMEGNRVSITAEVKKDSEEKEGEKVLRSERYYGEVSRQFMLEHEVDESGADARFSDGVLELVLPKKAMTAKRKLEIH